MVFTLFFVMPLFVWAGSSSHVNRIGFVLISIVNEPKQVRVRRTMCSLYSMTIGRSCSVKMRSNYTINQWINTLSYQINVDMMFRYRVINVVCSSRQSSEAKLDRQESLSETHRDTESPVLDQQSPAVPQWVSPAPPCLSPTTSPGIVSQGESQLITYWCHPPYPYSWHHKWQTGLALGKQWLIGSAPENMHEAPGLEVSSAFCLSVVNEAEWQFRLLGYCPLVATHTSSFWVTTHSHLYSY